MKKIFFLLISFLFLYSINSYSIDFQPPLFATGTCSAGDFVSAISSSSVTCTTPAGIVISDFEEAGTPPNTFFQPDAANTTGGFRTNDGTVAIPTFSFLNNTNTGFWSSAADRIDITLGGVNLFYFLTDGLHFISTSSPFLFFNDGSGRRLTIRGQTVSNGSAIFSSNGLTLSGAEFPNHMFINSTGDVQLMKAKITVGTGTGLTVNDVGSLKHHVYKVTLTFAGLSAVALTANHIIATLPAKTKIIGIIADTTIKYAGTGVTNANIVVGIDAGVLNAFLLTHDVLTAPITVGDADADLGTLIIRANAVSGGYIDWVNTTPISVQITTVGANTDQLTAGSTTYYIETVRYD